MVSHGYTMFLHYFFTFTVVFWTYTTVLQCILNIYHGTSMFFFYLMEFFIFTMIIPQFLTFTLVLPCFWTCPMVTCFLKISHVFGHIPLKYHVFHIFTMTIPCFWKCSMLIPYFLTCTIVLQCFWDFYAWNSMFFLFLQWKYNVFKRFTC